MDKKDLVAGGQGHSEREIEDAAISCGLLTIAFVISVVIFIIVSVLFAEN